MKTRAFFILVILALLMWGCRTAESLSEIPHVSFSRYDRVLNAAGKDSLIRLTFSYIDGDGDLGLRDQDTLPPFNYSAFPFNKFYFDVFIDYFEKVGGKFSPVVIPNTSDTVRFYYRMDRITPEGKNKAIRGDISMVLDLSPYETTPDTIKFVIQIADRQLHLSNFTESPQIPVTF